MKIQNNSIPSKNKAFLTKISNSAETFVMGTLASFWNISVLQPVEYMKVRIQVKSEELAAAKRAGIQLENQGLSMVKIIKETYQRGGIKIFYKGLDAGITRQFFYGTTRLGVYRKVFNVIKEKKAKDRNLFMSEKIICGLTAGFFAAIIGNPAELAMVRMQHDSMLPLDQKRGYNSVFQTFGKIIHEEGFLGLWTGVGSNIARAMVIVTAMLAPYDEFKERLSKLFNKQDSKAIQLTAAAMAGIVGGITSLPLDRAKTAMQKMKPNAQGEMPYKSLVHCLSTIAKQEGVGKLWVGLPTYCWRQGLSSVVTQTALEFLTKKWKKVRSAYEF